MHFAKKYNLTPVGTIAQYVVSEYLMNYLIHLIDSEWFMGVSLLQE